MDAFVGNWTIRGWIPDKIKKPGNGIPEYAFQVPGLLSILKTGDGSYALQWLDQTGSTNTVSGLQAADAPSPTLMGFNLPVTFGHRIVACNLVLTMAEMKLTGEIAASDPGSGDVGSGTFTGEANPVPPPVMEYGG